MSAPTPAPATKLPSYRRQKRTGRADLAFVEIDGVRRYLGEYGTADSKQKYQAVLAEWQATGWVPPADVHDVVVAVIVDFYWTHAGGYYKKPDGSPTSELELIRLAMLDLVALYGKRHRGDPLFKVAISKRLANGRRRPRMRWTRGFRERRARGQTKNRGI